MTEFDIDPKLDLVLERTIDVPIDKVWAAWTRAEHIRNWFVPAPWTITECEIDLRPGGIFHTVMRSPDGDEFPNTGCILEVVTNHRFVWTDALLPGFRPANEAFFTAMLTLKELGDGTVYTARAIHRDPAGRARHEEMGFFDGWGTCLDQLVTYSRTMD